MMIGFHDGPTVFSTGAETDRAGWDMGIFDIGFLFPVRRFLLASWKVLCRVRYKTFPNDMTTGDRGWSGQGPGMFRTRRGV